MIDDISSNTPPEVPQKMKVRGKPFVHGDPRINRKGRPKSFDQLRRLAVLVAGEEDTVGITRVLEMLRDMAKSKDPAKQVKFLEYAYGKPKDEVDINQTGKSEIVIRYADNPTETTPEAVADQGGEKEI